MENLLTLYDNFLLSLQNMNTNILVEYLNNYDIFNQLVLLRNNKENIKCYIKTNIYFSPLINTNKLLSIRDIYIYNNISNNILFENFYCKYIHIFIFFMILRNYLTKPEKFKLLNDNYISIIYNIPDKLYLIQFLKIFGYTEIKTLQINNEEFYSIFYFNFNNIQKIYKYFIIKKYNYKISLLNYNIELKNNINYKNLKINDIIKFNNLNINISTLKNIFKKYNINYGKYFLNSIIFKISNIITYGNKKHIRLIIQNKIDNFNDINLLNLNSNIDLIY